MTTPLIPDFVVKMFENEVAQVVKSALKAVADTKGHDMEELEAIVQKNLDLSLKLIPPSEEIVKVIKVKPRRIPQDSERCCANVMSKGIISRCKFSRADNITFCRRHSSTQKYGVFGDTPPQPVNKLKKYQNIF